MQTNKKQEKKGLNSRLYKNNYLTGGVICDEKALTKDGRYESLHWEAKKKKIVPGSPRNTAMSF